MLHSKGCYETYKDGLAFSEDVLVSSIIADSCLRPAVAAHIHSQGDAVGENHLAEGEGMGTNGGQEHRRDGGMDHGPTYET